MLIDAGVIETSGDVWRIVRDRLDPGRVPSTLAGVLQARLDGLQLRAAHGPAAGLRHGPGVLGRGRRRPRCDGGKRAADLASALSVAVERELVLRREPSTFVGCAELTFKHGLLRDVVYDTVLLRHRRTLHALAARWLAGRAGERATELAAAIAEHYDLAEDRDAAAAWYLEAGRQAAARHAHHEAVRLLRRALELTDAERSEARFDVLAELEEVHNRRGDRRSSDWWSPVSKSWHLTSTSPAACDSCSAGAASPGSPASSTRSPGSAEEMVARARAGLGASKIEAAALLWWGKALGWQGPNDAAAPLLEAAIDRARAGGQPSIAGEALRFLAIIANNAGRYDDAIAYLDAAREKLRSAGDLDGEANVVGQLGSILFNRGEYDAAWTAIEASRVSATERLPLWRGDDHHEPGHYRHRSRPSRRGVGATRMRP